LPHPSEKDFTTHYPLHIIFGDLLKKRPSFLFPNKANKKIPEIKHPNKEIL